MSGEFFSAKPKNEMKKNIFLIIIVLGFWSCQKADVTTAGVDVYVAGYEFDRTLIVSKYWKNGNPVILGEGYATSITVSGSDVYVCGTGVGGATYWKNGSPVTLGEGYASSIVVSGNDVYVAGNIRDHAVYWKNGNPTYLPENTRPVTSIDDYPVVSTESQAYSIFISGTDIYIAGGETITKMISPSPNPDYITGIAALYWKNGNPVYLIQGSYTDSKNDKASSIFVAGQDVHASGLTRARYWKNENSFYLPGSNDIYTKATSISVSEGDVYLSGTQHDGGVCQASGPCRRSVAKYWKNGNPVKLTDGTKNAYTLSIAISGADVYVAGYEENTADTQDYVAKYWKNGKPVTLGGVSNRTFATSIFVAKK